MSRPVPHLFFRARAALRMNQQELATRLGASRRTGQRWDAGHSHLAAQQVHELARLVYPVDAAFAQELAAFADTTLEALGLARPEPPATDVPAVPATGHVVDSIVCAAAEAMDVSPRAIRPALLAAFTRARELGLRVEAVEGALAPKRRATKPSRSAG